MRYSYIDYPYYISIWDDPEGPMQTIIQVDKYIYKHGIHRTNHPSFAILIAETLWYPYNISSTNLGARSNELLELSL